MHPANSLFFLASVCLFLGCSPATTAEGKKSAKHKPPVKAPAATVANAFPQVQQSDFASVDDALEKVVVLAMSGDSDVGAKLLKIETWLEMQGPRIAPELAAKIKDPMADLAIRLTACRVLSKLGAVATPTLLEAMNGEPRQLRLKATECLGRVKPADPQVVKKLIAFIDDSDLDQRKVSITALATIGPPAREAVPKLIALLNDPQEDETIRSIAKQALKEVDPRKGLMNAY